MKDPVAKFDDPKVQAVYEILCNDEAPPKSEHWEGFIARRIVDALAQSANPQTPDDLLRQSEQEGWRWAKECEAEVKRLKELAKPVQDTRLKVKLGRQYGYDLNGHWFYLQPADEYAEAAIAKATGEQA